MPLEPTCAAAAARPQRSFPGKAIVINALRIVHLAGVVGLGAAVLAQPVAMTCDLFCAFVAVSGAAIMLLDWWSNPRYPFQVKGAGMAAKLVLVTWMALDATHRVALFWIVLAFSSALSHAPGRLRNRILLPRRGI